MQASAMRFSSRADPKFLATGSHYRLAESVLLPKAWEVICYLKVCIAIPLLWCKSSTVLQVRPETLKIHGRDQGRGMAGAE